MKSRSLIAILVFVALVLGYSGVALAHGEPVITLVDKTVKAGGHMMITGSKMHPGAVYSITLESMEGSTHLGRAKAGKNGGVSARVVLPAQVAPGSHRVRIAAKGGKPVLLNLNVTPEITNKRVEQSRTISDVAVQVGRKKTAAQEGGTKSKAMLMPKMPSADLLRLKRTKSPVVIGGAVLLMLSSLTFGMVLVRMRGFSEAKGRS